MPRTGIKDLSLSAVTDLARVVMVCVPPPPFFFFFLMESTTNRRGKRGWWGDMDSEKKSPAFLPRIVNTSSNLLSSYFFLI